MKMSYFEENIANNKQVDEATKRYSLSRQSSELGRKIKEAKMLFGKLNTASSVTLK